MRVQKKDSGFTYILFAPAPVVYIPDKLKTEEDIMELVKVIEAFVKELEWNDEVELDPETGDSALGTNMEIRNQIFDLYIDGRQEQETLALHLYPPFNVIEGKSMDAVLLCNYINDHYSYQGRLTLTDGGRIRYREVLDSEDIEPAPAILHNMLSSGVSLFKAHIEQIAAVALTRKSYESVREEYDKKEEIEKSRRDREENP
ncbi:type III secretion system chaperone family protein [Chlorobium phaeovibrioides]|uniref:YbjN domain-containing protein n=1 Tax=Chlorobium phaeovibrioides TaxID=1094 RepID=UPI001CB8A6C9|nr:YbjN domain-containing protein [Chlorobium phaeovibrioides]